MYSVVHKDSSEYAVELLLLCWFKHKTSSFFFKKKQLGYSYISLTKLKKKVLEQHSFCDANTSTP